MSFIQVTTQIWDIALVEGVKWVFLWPSLFSYNLNLCDLTMGLKGKMVFSL